MEMKSKVKRYWEYTAKGYSSIIKDELNSFRVKAWIDIINKEVGKKGNLNVLDVGCGPGFFSIILSKEGHNVVGIDCTDNMIKQASFNAKNESVSPKFMSMDSHKLDFEDNTFDLIISRNVTWTLANPLEAYKEWNRVLKPGGNLLIFDANWNLHKFNEDIKKETIKREKLFIEKYGPVYNTYKGPEEFVIKELLPLEDKIRPEWDINVLSKIGYENFRIEKDITDKVWGAEETLLYGATPMFMISCQKIINI